VPINHSLIDGDTNTSEFDLRPRTTNNTSALKFSICERKALGQRICDLPWKYFAEAESDVRHRIVKQPEDVLEQVFFEKHARKQRHHVLARLEEEQPVAVVSRVAQVCGKKYKTNVFKTHEDVTRIQQVDQD